MVNLLIAPRRNEPIVNADGTPTLRMAEFLESLVRGMNELIEVTDVANKVIVNGIQPGITAEVLYTAPSNGSGTKVVAFTAANGSATPSTYDLYIVPVGGTADDSNILVSVRSVAIDSTDVPPEVLNQLIPAGGTLQGSVADASTIAFRATGFEL